MAGRTVLVTGSTGGIAKATALGLAAMGAHVAVTGRDPARVQQAAREFRTATAAHVDEFVAALSSQLQVRRLADELLAALPRIDVLVNNVGGYWNTRASFGTDDPGRVQRLVAPIMRPVMKAPAQGAATSVHVASTPELERVSGRYVVNSKSKRSWDASYDAPTAARCWRVIPTPSHLGAP